MLVAISSIIGEMYADLYDINLYIYKARKNVTIIDVLYYRRSSLTSEYKELVKMQETLLHSKVATPIYYGDKKEKFDIHWQSGTFNHKWKLFWWRLTDKDHKRIKNERNKP